RERHRGRAVASLVYDLGSCSQASSSSRRALYAKLREDGGIQDPLRARD
ncbi:unnamed protein product, partial [Urochloa humidicola]